MFRRILFLLIAFPLFLSTSAHAQRFLMDLVDTTNQMGKGMLSIYERYNRVRISGYIQPQFQYISKKGAETFAGPNFPELSNNRFMLRRGRLRVDYAHLNDKGEPTSYFVFQFDGTERGVAIRDFWGRFYENKFKIFALTTGMFARPFGYEVNLSSANRESPERGRMSQTLMKTERDIGVMLTATSRTITNGLSLLKFDFGVFNGQGMSGPADYDSHKDVIGRLSLKPVPIQALGGSVISAGVAVYRGGITSQSDVIYRASETSDGYVMQKDSAALNYKKLMPRNYAGADFQIRFSSERFTTELRAEYIQGMQTATFASSETPGTYPVTNSGKAPLYARNFNGAYFYLVQNLGSADNQFIAKYDWYDPNTKVAGREMTAQKGFSRADVKYNTLGLGFIHHANESLKFTLFYEFVKNEGTSLPDFQEDVSDNVLSCRVQYDF